MSTFTDFDRYIEIIDALPSIVLDELEGPIGAASHSKEGEAFCDQEQNGFARVEKAQETVAQLEQIELNVPSISKQVGSDTAKELTDPKWMDPDWSILDDRR